MCPLVRKDLQRIFEKLDKNKDGFVNLEELNWLLDTIGLLHCSIEELEAIVGIQTLNFNDFLCFYDSISMNRKVDNEDVDRIMDEEDDGNDLEEAFRVFDINGDGFISSDDLQITLSRLGLWDELSGKDCKSMICVYDTNSDGVLDFEEFKKMMLLSVCS